MGRQTGHVPQQEEEKCDDRSNIEKPEECYRHHQKHAGEEDAYHLPPVFQYLINHRISLLPVEARAQFAYPQNTEPRYKQNQATGAQEKFGGPGIEKKRS